MTTRPPFTYSTPADIVRIVHFGLQSLSGITDAQYAEALAVVQASKPVIEYRTLDIDDESEARADREWARAQDDKWELKHTR